MSKKIKCQKVYRIDHVPGAEIPEAEDYGILQSLEEFDEKGNLVLEIGYTRDGDIGDKCEYRYDDSNRVVETLIYGEDDEILERTETTRDKDGRILKEIVHYLDGTSDIRTFFYNEKGSLTGMEVKDDEDEPDFSERYHYKDDKLVKIERFNEDNEVVFFQEDNYEDGVLRQRKVWSSEDEEPFTLITEFNEKGIRVKETRFDSRDKMTERNIYEADEQGRPWRVIEENRLRKNTTEVSFDEKGNMFYQKETDMNGELNHEIFRTFDDNGNLLTATVEMVQKNSGEKRAYTMVYRYEYSED
jgi:hypothetical protein